MLYSSVTVRIIHNRPSASKIQPMELSGRLEATRAPTRGKARKSTKLKVSPTVLTVNELPGDCADRARTPSATLAKNMATQSVASDQASHAAARALMPPVPRLCFLDPSVTTTLYSRAVSQA